VVPYFCHQLNNPWGLVAWQLAALQHKGPESQFVALLAALQHLLGGQHVALHVAVALAYAAIQAVVAAHVGKLHEPPHKDAMPKLCYRHLSGLLMQVGDNSLVVTLQQCPVAVTIQVPLSPQYVNYMLHSLALSAIKRL